MSGQKTEEPTPQRLRQLRKKGDVPKSREVAKTVSLIFALAALLLVAQIVPATFNRLLAGARADTDLSVATVTFLFEFARLALPFIGVAAIGGVIGELSQSGFLFSPGRLIPDAKRFKIGSVWAQRLKKDALFQGGTALVFASLSIWVGVRGVHAMAREAPLVLRNLREAPDPLAVVRPLGHVIGCVALLWVGLSVLASVLDLVWQRRSFSARNKMSKQEIKDEHKQSEGDPDLKARRKAMHRELLQHTPLRAVLDATVVVRNPTHVVIGLRYNQDADNAPVVVAAGRGAHARTLLKLARTRAIPEVTMPTLARELIHLPPGDEVPYELYDEVAVIFRWLLEPSPQHEHTTRP